MNERKDEEHEENQIWIIRYEDGKLLAFYGTKSDAEEKAKEKDMEYTVA
ncbi:MAG: hypothetical protein LUD72_06665 [Bacteroidales bacterium]|nr:hypothetical protein [Bacteroidales bacterium]